MQDDILSVEVGLEGPTQAASFKLYYQETTPISSGSSAQRLGDGFVDQMNVPLRNVLSNQWHFRHVIVRKHAIEEDVPYYRTASITALDTIGTNDSQAVPANNALILTLVQQRLSSKSNGRVFIPGMPVDESNGGILTSLFVLNQVNALQVAVATQVQDSGDTGIFSLGVISQKILNAVPETKDWEGAFSFVTQVGANPILGIQRRRTTKTRGALERQ